MFLRIPLAQVYRTIPQIDRNDESNIFWNVVRLCFLPFLCFFQLLYILYLIHIRCVYIYILYIYMYISSLSSLLLSSLLLHYFDYEHIFTNICIYAFWRCYAGIMTLWNDQTAAASLPWHAMTNLIHKWFKSIHLIHLRFQIPSGNKHSYWNWPLIEFVPIENCDFP